MVQWRFVAQAAGIAMLFTAAGTASAQTWPVRSMRWIVPYTAGGNVDLSARAVGQKVGEALGQQVLIDNHLVNDGDLIVLTIGEPIGKPGGTNTMKIVRVGDSRKP